MIEHKTFLVDSFSLVLLGFLIYAARFSRPFHKVCYVLEDAMKEAVNVKKAESSSYIAWYHINLYLDEKIVATK